MYFKTKQRKSRQMLTWLVIIAMFATMFTPVFAEYNESGYGEIKLSYELKVDYEVKVDCEVTTDCEQTADCELASNDELNTNNENSGYGDNVPEGQYNDLYYQIKEDAEDEYYKEEEILPALFAPFGSGVFSARLTGLGQNVDFTTSVQNPFSVDIFTSTTTPQTLRVEAVFSTSSTTHREIVIELENGLAFASMPGMVPNRALRPDSWTFDSNTLLAPFPGVIMGATYTPNPDIVQERNGIENNRYRPRAGRLIYTIAPGVSSVVIEISVTSDWAFAPTIKANGRSINDAITVRTYEGAALPLVPADLNNSAVLGSYALTGNTIFRAYTLNPRHRDLALDPGDSWATNVTFASRGTSNVGQFLHEEIEFIIRVPKELTDNADLGVNILPGSVLTSNNFEYVIDSVIDPSFHIITITLIQVNLQNIGGTSQFEVYGTIPALQPPTALLRSVGPSSPATVTTAAGSSFIPLGHSNSIMEVGWYGTQRIRVAAPWENRLTVRPVGANSTFSGMPSDGALAPLGGFLLENEFTQSLTNQAVRITVPLATQEYIGIRAFRLPAGENGIRNVRAVTTTGRLIERPGPLAINAPGTEARPFDAVNVNFHDELGPDEFIVELYYELYGDIPVGAGFAATSSFGNPTGTLSFVYFGRILRNPGELLPAGTIMPVHAVAGLICSTDPSGIDVVLRTTATTNMQVPIPGAGANPSWIRDPHFQFNTWTNLNNVTVIGGETRQNATVTFATQSHQHRAAIFAVQGFYVYLRSPAGVLNIERSSIEANWGGQLFSEAHGNATIEVLTDSTGSRVYRLELGQVTIGRLNANMAYYPGVVINMAITALPTAPRISVPIRDLVMISSIRDDIYMWQAHDHGRTLTDAFHIGNIENGDTRTLPGQIVGATPATEVMHIVPRSDLLFHTEIRQGAGVWQSFNWDTGNTVTEVRPDPLQPIQYRVTMVNNTGVAVPEFYILIPIPKFNQTYSTNLELQRNSFGWPMSLAGQVTIPAGFEVLYSETYADIATNATWEVWNQIPIEDIRMVKIRNTMPIPADITEYFYVYFAIADDVNFATQIDTVNTFAAMTFRSFPAATTHSGSTPVAMRLTNNVDVTFNANHGVTPVTVIRTVVRGETYAAAMNYVDVVDLTTNRTGFTFGGWFNSPANANGTGTVGLVEPGDTVTNAANHTLYARWNANTYTIIYNANGGTGTMQNGTATFGQNFTLATNTFFNLGYTFTGWNTAANGTGDAFSDGHSFAPWDIANNLTLYAQWDANPTVEVTFNANHGTPPETAIKDITYGATYAPGMNHADVVALQTRTGFNFLGWWTTPETGGERRLDTSIVPDYDHTLYARWQRRGGGTTPPPAVEVEEPGIPLVFIEDHIWYVRGFGAGEFRPNNSITRAEMSMILFRLLDSAEKYTPRTNNFSDVSTGWYAQAVSYLASLDIVRGYPDGTFRPNATITRAELTAVMSRFFEINENGTHSFNDVSGSHWAILYINNAVNRGWILGYEDGTFRPNNDTTRAEAVTLLNRVLGRIPNPVTIRYHLYPHLEHYHDKHRLFTDLTDAHWAYYQIMEAATEHDFTRDNAGLEIWTEVRIPWL